MNNYNFLNRLIERVKRPSTILVGVAAIACGAIAYVGIRILVIEKLPPFIEEQLSNTINRPVDLGEVKSFSLNRIKFGSSFLPATSSDNDRVEIQGIDVNFNILPLLLQKALPVEITLVKPKVYIKE